MLICEDFVDFGWLPGAFFMEGFPLIKFTNTHTHTHARAFHRSLDNKLMLKMTTKF